MKIKPSQSAILLNRMYAIETSAGAKSLSKPDYEQDALSGSLRFNLTGAEADGFIEDESGVLEELVLDFMTGRTKSLKTLFGSSFFDHQSINALTAAQQYAGKNGFVVSMPEFLHASVLSQDYSDSLWQGDTVALSEICVGKTKKGSPVAIFTHGFGLVSSLDRLERYNMAVEDSMSKMQKRPLPYDSLLSGDEINLLLEGKISKREQIPVYSFNKFKRGISDLGRKYAVVMPWSEALKCANGYRAADVFYDDPAFIVEAGGVNAAGLFIDKLKAKDTYSSNTNFVNSLSLTLMNPDSPSGKLLVFQPTRGGIYGCSLTNGGRFIAVSDARLKAYDASSRKMSLDDFTDAILEGNPLLDGAKLRLKISDIYAQHNM